MESTIIIAQGLTKDCRLVIITSQMLQNYYECYKIARGQSYNEETGNIFDFSRFSAFYDSDADTGDS